MTLLQCGTGSKTNSSQSSDLTWNVRERQFRSIVRLAQQLFAGCNAIEHHVEYETANGTPLLFRGASNLVGFLVAAPNEESTHLCPNRTHDVAM